MKETKSREKRYVISVTTDVLPMIQEVQKILQKQMPSHLGRVRISKALAVETAIKAYLEKNK